MRKARKIPSNNPQTDPPPESISKFRAKIAPESFLRLRDQNRLYAEEVGREALARQLKLGRISNANSTRGR